MILALALGRTAKASELAQEFGVSPGQLKSWARKGYLQVTRPPTGRGFRYSRDEVIRLLAFGEDWAGRKVRPGTRDARRIVRALEESGLEPADFELRGASRRWGV